MGTDTTQGFTELYRKDEVVAVVFDDDKHTCYITQPTEGDHRVAVIAACRAAVDAGYQKVAEQFTTGLPGDSDAFETTVLTNL